MKRICVFAGSSAGGRSEYADGAERLGQALAGRGLELVYGAGDVGLMGALADSAIGAGGHVIGIIPRALVDREVAHRGLSDLRIVSSMHERKALMAELSDGFIALPGGLGTFEEFTEILTWAQLGIHIKPCGLLNIVGYYDRWLEFLDQAVAESFVVQKYRDLVLVESDAEVLLDRFERYRPPDLKRWADSTET